jgi:hypothetical protein
MRTVLATLVVALLVVPALARAQQTLDPGRGATTTSSFSKSVDVPPDYVSVAPDLSVTLLDIEAVLHPVHGSIVCLEQTLPVAPDFLDSDPLRGPPLSRM